MSATAELTDDPTAAGSLRPTPLLVVNDLVKTFGNGVRAVDGVSLTVHKGETLGLVGESGCGKSTTAKMILRLLAPDAGLILLGDDDLTAVRGRQLRQMRARMQLVPQDPQTSFNPRLSIRSSIEFNLRAQRIEKAERARRVAEAMERVGMPMAYGQRFPHELSGGQLQRAAIARALVTSPELIVCDEAVSALDKSIQAQVLNLLVELQQDLGMAYLFISHDLSVVEHLSDRVLVMYLGRVVEEASAAQLWARPRHPYTEALLSAAPSSGRTRIMLTGDPPSPVNPPSGCTFRTRCPVALPACAEERPLLQVTDPHHLVACVNEARTAA